MLERLLELGKSVLAESDLDGVLTAAIDGVIELCGAERGLILLFDPDGEAAAGRWGWSTSTTGAPKGCSPRRRRGWSPASRSSSRSPPATPWSVGGWTG